MRRLNRKWDITKLTNKNKLTYLLKRLIKYRRNKSDDDYESIAYDASHVFHTESFCDYCGNDDLGYCGLRESNLSHKEVFDNFCIDVVISCIQNKL